MTVTEKYRKLHGTKKFELNDMIQLLALLHQRNMYLEHKLKYYTDGLAAGEKEILEMIEYCNDEIKKFLNI